MTTAAGMQVDHHLHHHAHMMASFSPFSFAASSVASVASKPGTGTGTADMSSSWPHLNSSSSCASNSAATSSSNASRDGGSNNRSPSANSSPCSNLTQAPSPPPALLNSSCTSTPAPGGAPESVFDAAAPPPPSSLTADQPASSSASPTRAAAATAAAAAAAALSPHYHHGTPPPPPTSPPCHSPSASPPPSAPQFLPSPPRSQASPNHSVNVAATRPSFPSFHLKPLSPYQAPGMEDVDAFLKDSQSVDMEQFLLELLQQPGPPTPASATANSPQHQQQQSSVSRSSSSPSGSQMRARQQLQQLQQQQQQQAGSTYQTLMEMALDSNSGFMDTAPATNSASYMDTAGGVKPSFVVSHHSANFADDSTTALRPSTNSALYTTTTNGNGNGNGGGCYMDTDSKDVLHYPHRTTFLEAMSTTRPAPSSASDQWMNLSSSTNCKPSEVDELEKEFMRIYGTNVNLRMRDVTPARVKTEPHLLRGSMAFATEAAAAAVPVKMESSTSFASSLDHHFDASDVGHSDTVMLELDPIPDSNLTSHDMNQLMADAFASSGMNHQPLDLSPNGLLHHHSNNNAAMNANHAAAAYACSAGLEIDPSIMQAQLSAAATGYFTAHSTGMQPQQQQHKSNQLLDPCMSSSWPGGGGGGGGGYKHYGQPLAQLKNNKMSVNFMAGQPTSNSNTLALVQAFAPTSSNGATTGAASHYHARRFFNSHSLPNLQHVTAASQPQLGNSTLANSSLVAHMGGELSNNCHLNRSNSLPSQRNAMGLMQGHNSPSQGSPLGGSPLGGSSSPYLGHSVSFPAEHRGGSPFLGPQHRIGSSPSLQSLAGGAANSYSNSLHNLHSQQHQQQQQSLSNSSALPQSPFSSVNSSSLSQAADFHGHHLSSLQHRPANLYRTHNPNAPNVLLSNSDDLSSIMPNLSAPDPAANNLSPVMMATGLQLVHLLIACAEAVADENMELAHVILERLSTLVLPLGNPMQRLAAYFAEALAARITRKNRGDLFRGLHGDKSVPKIEKIEAMSVMYDCVPTGKFGHLTANQVLLDAIETEQNVHLVDLHIWYGMQWPAFMQALASREGGPPNLRISAVGSSYEELKETGETLQECAKQLNVPLEFCPIVVPLEEFNVRLLEVRRGEVCVVNAFSQLHCLLHKGADNFNRILRGLRSLNPKVFALTENDGNHNSPIFLTRFMECLRYYSAVFDAFEASMPAESTARMKTEQLFAAQTIRNIIACEGTDRIERHETMVEWGKRMEAAGFSSVPLSGRAVSQAELLLNLYYSNGYTLANNNGYLALGWHTMPLIGVSAWR